MRQVGVFAKYWQAGAVKTRLAEAVGSSRASSLQRAFLETLLARFMHVPCRRVLAYAPDERWADFAALAGIDWELIPQVEGDLGDRMAAYFRQAFAAGATRVVLLGADSPNVPLPIVDLAFERLDEFPVVLGPADDGGYYLIGMRPPLVGVFTGIAWSRPTVYRDTVERLRAAGLPWSELAAWYDVDRGADLTRLIRDLHLAGTIDPALAKLSRAIGEILLSGAAC